MIEPMGKRVSQWGEGPIWWQGKLYYVDIENGLVIEHQPDTNAERQWDVSSQVGRVGTVVPRASGGLIVAGDQGIFSLDTESGEVSAIADPEPHLSDNRFNDGKCSPDGRFFAGTISLTKQQGTAALYRLDKDLSLHTAYSGVTNSNGVAWSADGKTCYYIDTPRLSVMAFDYHADTGALSNERIVIDTSHIPASPDGMTIDRDGNLWIAFCHGSCVANFSPTTGEELRRIPLPCLETTACAFGGELLDELYVTTGIHKSEVEPHAGRLFRVTGLGVSGVPADAFAG
ncbi:MAG: SMP-30/gluconolactonase/LRE family protein [Akkermansiaceae bacterium]